MSYIYWTADLHLSHNETIQYCNRPYRDWQHMNKSLIGNINSRLTPSDILMHIGDYCFTNKWIRHKASYYEDQMHCTTVHILGNHDRNNSVKGCIEYAIVRICGKTAWVRHQPPGFEEFDSIPKDVDLIICGHVHDAWKSKIAIYDKNKRIIPIINVGCDVWNYRPVRSDELIAYYHKIMKDYKEIVKSKDNLLTDWKKGMEDFVNGAGHTFVQSISNVGKDEDR